MFGRPDRIEAALLGQYAELEVVGEDLLVADVLVVVLEDQKDADVHVLLLVFGITEIDWGRGIQ
ncbi:Uncharacterised protein [Gordonia bronchialis]|nr:Uncharacterised protein [Gordonia bronchialis]